MDLTLISKLSHIIITPFVWKVTENMLTTAIDKELMIFKFYFKNIVSLKLSIVYVEFVKKNCLSVPKDYGKIPIYSLIKY